MMGYSNYGMGGGGWLVMTLVMIAFWSLVIFAIAAIFRGTRSNAPGGTAPGGTAPSGTSGGGAEQILAERLARGEIDGEEYRSRKAALRSD
jgi:putative membrane protein